MVTKQDEKTDEIWIENCTGFNSNFTSERGNFKLAPEGEVGSIISIDKKLQRDNYVMRALQRNKIRVLSDQDAMAKMGDLVEPPESDQHHWDILKYLSEGASDITDRYQKKLVEEAEPSGPRQSPEQIFKTNGQGSQAASSKTVTRSSDQEDKVSIESAKPFKVTIKPKAHEGDLESNTQNF